MPLIIGMESKNLAECIAAVRAIYFIPCCVINGSVNAPVNSNPTAIKLSPNKSLPIPPNTAANVSFLAKLFCDFVK